MLDRSRCGIIPLMAKPKRPRDVNQLAKLIVDMSTGNAPADPESVKNPAAVALGRLGGAKGGPARAIKLTAAQRSEIAKNAAKARWLKAMKNRKLLGGKQFLPKPLDGPQLTEKVSANHIVGKAPHNDKRAK